MLLGLGGRNPRPFIKIVKNMRRSDACRSPVSYSRRHTAAISDYIFKNVEDYLNYFKLSDPLSSLQQQL